jgi:hypothetical protein
MKISYRFLVIAAAALLTNGMSTLGFAEGSAGGVARAFECKSSIARSSEIARTVERVGVPLLLIRKHQTALAVHPESLVAADELDADWGMRGFKGSWLVPPRLSERWMSKVPGRQKTGQEPVAVVNSL